MYSFGGNVEFVFQGPSDYPRVDIAQPTIIDAYFKEGADQICKESKDSYECGRAKSRTQIPELRLPPLARRSLVRKKVIQNL